MKIAYKCIYYNSVLMPQMAVVQWSPDYMIIYLQKIIFIIIDKGEKIRRYLPKLLVSSSIYSKGD